MVYALGIDSKNNIYIGGYFFDTCVWNGTTLTVLEDSQGNKLNQIVNAIMVDPQDNVYFGGSIGDFGTITNVHNLITFNTVSKIWNPVNDKNNQGLNGQCCSIVYDSKINSVIVGGSFSNLTDDTLILNNVGRYSLTDKKWYSLGNGVKDYVLSIVMDVGGNLFIGGYFQNGIVEYTNDFINILWKTGKFGTLTNINKSITVYTNNKNEKYLGFTQTQNNVISNF